MPPPVSTAEALPGGVGIVADDLVAGALAGVVVGVVGRWLFGPA
jgi:phosphatidylglycerophosphatase A